MLLGFRARNHPQQTMPHGPVDDVDDRATQPIYFMEWQERFGEFTLDVAAAAHNTKCDRYFDRETDGLSQSWAGERVWCNPPYSAIESWVRKAWDEAPGTRDRAGSGLRVEFLPGRMRFIKAGALDVGPNERPPFGVCLLIWEGGVA